MLATLCHLYTQAPILAERQQHLATFMQLQAAARQLGPFACGVQQAQLAEALHANLMQEGAALRTLSMVVSGCACMVCACLHGVPPEVACSAWRWACLVW